MAYERWDRDRFEREKEYDEREYYQEEDYRRPYAPARERSRGPPVRESERIFFENRHTSGAPVPYRDYRDDFRYYDERESTYERGGDMVPYREREDDRELDIRLRRARESERPFQRPMFLRRQSSLDTHDRRALPRPGDRVHDEYYSPRRERFYEDIRVAEPDYYGDEDYHPYRERERETFRRRYPPPPPPARQGEEVVYEREEVTKSGYPKRGKTRMPRRLVNIRAIMDLGYQFEEEEKTIVILKALGKDNIDEVIRISREYNATPMPPPPMNQPVPPPDDEEIVTRRTEIIRENPSLPSSSSSSRASSPSTAVTRKTKKSHKSRRRQATALVRPRPSRSEHRSKSTRRHRSASLTSARTRELVIREDVSSDDEPHTTALILPRHERRSLSEELRALELERKALQYEREAKEAKEAKHSHDYLVEKEYRDGSVEVKKERNGKMKLILNP